MAEPPGVSFASFLRQLRTDAGLTQQELAEAASLSTRSISDMERGVNLTARRETVRLLADALQLAGSRRAWFEAAARGRTPERGFPPFGIGVGGAAAATRTLPRDIAGFTGRAAELRELADAASPDGVVAIHAIDGMAGIGKTAFAVHAAHQFAPRFPDGQIFLALHAHTPAQPPVDPADALASLLLTVGVGGQQIPPGLEPRMGLWRAYAAGKKLLLLLDDAAGHEQVRPLLPGTAGSLVLVTSRRRLTALEDVQSISLDTLPEDEAAELFIRLAARTGLHPGDAAVRQTIRLCGCLPLAVGLLARQLCHHGVWTTADLAADLTAARNRLEMMHAENLSAAAAFDLSYQDLSTAQQQFFRRMGLHPGTDIDAYAAAALGNIDLVAASRHLEELYDQHLLSEPAHGRYRLHDLIREYARALAVTDPPAESGAAVRRLLDYYLHTARAADRYLAGRTPGGMAAPTGPLPRCTPDLKSRAEAARWMTVERLNLHAATAYAATHGRSGHVIAIPAAMHGFLHDQGHWDQALTLHRAALTAARRTGDRLAEADALTDIADMQHMNLNYPAATASLGQAIELYRELGSRLGEANALVVFGIVQRLTDYPAAAASLTRALDLYRELRNQLGQANVLYQLGLAQTVTAGCQVAAATLSQALDLHRELGNKHGEASALSYLSIVQYLTGDYPAAGAGLTRALRIFRELGERHGEATALNYLGVVQYLTGDYPAATASLTRALRIFRELSERLGEANTLNYVAVLDRLAGDYPAATANHTRALQLYQDLGDPVGEAYAINYLGVVQYQTGDYPAAIAGLTRALHQFERVGDHFGAADALNNLGELTLASSMPGEARARHQQALTLATEIGSPLREATALEGIGRCDLLEGQPGEGAAMLRRALSIYQRIGSPHADRVAATLRDHSQ
jgi:tetratricopeptide (TPR) repeat protein/transcriptional regulator with XRE-family HTH domain